MRALFLRRKYVHYTAGIIKFAKSCSWPVKITHQFSKWNLEARKLATHGFSIKKKIVEIEFKKLTLLWNFSGNPIQPGIFYKCISGFARYAAAYCKQTSSLKQLLAQNFCMLINSIIIPQAPREKHNFHNSGK